MKDSNRIIGNLDNINYFKNLIDRNILSHAYMIIGPEKSGKYLLTKTIISLLLSDDNDKYRLFENECPDVITIDVEEGKKSISIDQIREAIKDIYLSPFEFSFKVYIIRNADKLTVQAQNSLLKSIEEPQDNVYFFLLTENSSSLLQTINSRVQKVYTELFDENTMFDILKENIENKSDDELRFVCRFSNGSIGKAQTLLNTDCNDYKIYNNVNKLFENLINKGVEYKYFNLLDDLNKCYFYNKKDKIENRNRFDLMLEYFLMGFRDIITTKVSADNKYLFFKNEDVMKYVYKFSLKNVNKIIENISELQYKKKYNYNVQIATKKFAIELWYNL